MFISDNIKKHIMILLLALCTLWGMVVVTDAYAESEAAEMDISASKTLQGGWYTYEPYQYEIEKNGIKTLTGLDYELVNLIAKQAKIKLEYQNMSWEDLLKAMEAGKKDFATGVLFTKEREKSFYYSIPYRHTSASLFLLQGKIPNRFNQSNAALLKYLKQNQFKLGVVSGFSYSDPMVNQYINDPLNANFIVKSKSDNENLDLLLSGDIDGFLADRIVGSSLIWHANSPLPIIEHRLKVSSPIYIIFSKKTVSPETVEQFNQSIYKVMHSESYRNIVSWYLYPAIVFQIRSALWFKITEIIGTIAFAISGLLIAFRERTTLFGAIILAILPSLGGGLIRDIIFGRAPVAALQSPVYLLSVLLTVFAGFIIIKILNHYRKQNKIPREIENTILNHAAIILTITDAIGLATFTVVGVMVSLLAKASPLWLWGPFFAFVTGAGGGILRDMLSKTRYIEALEGEFYGEIAIIWGFFLSMYILLSTKQAQPEYIEYAVVVTILGVFISRLLVHFMHLPNFTFKHLK
ncbi:MAG: TRIC cation channel family protein [Gammaproteobacteria bacterium]|nr:TRIC cation channel family protein [Gammaproteobacteria bacterium]